MNVLDWFRLLLSRHASPSRWGVRPRTRRWLLWLSGTIVTIGLIGYQGYQSAAVAQQSDQTVQTQENQLIRQYTLPSTPPQPPVYRPQPAPNVAPAPQSPADSGPSPAAETPTAPPPAPTAPAKSSDKPKDVVLPTSEYVLEFNRDRTIGNRFRLQGVYASAPFEFTRPRLWTVKAAKAVIRYQHSPALLSGPSHLMVMVNDTNVGSVPLKLKDSQIGEYVVDIPPKLIQDFNTLTVAAEQSNSPTCANPADPNLWTQVLPDSKLLFTFQPQPVPLTFSQYPFPLFDDLNLDANRIAYLPPAKVNDTWLTAVARFETSLGRLADYRPLETRLVRDLSQLQWNDRLAIIGTPAEQPLLKELQLPFAIANDRVLDGSKNAFPSEVGLLMLTTAPSSGVPVLVATGNSPEGVAKAVQFLVQPQNREIGTGQAVIVSDLDEVASPPARQWPRYLPVADSFKLSDLKTQAKKPFQDTTVRGTAAAPIEFDFRALPDDRFNRGSTMNLVYSYSAQVNPRASAVDVAIDGVGIGSKRLTDKDGGTRETLKVNLPETLIKPNSKIQVSFRLSPIDPAKCGIASDQRLWGTVHSDTSFELKRSNSVQLPDLKLLTFGFPVGAPQDLSNTTIALPDNPAKADVMTLLAVSERLGRLSQANSVKLDVYSNSTLPAAVRAQHHLIGIGIREKFPFPEVFKANGFRLKDVFTRQWNQAQVQTLPDSGGIVKEIMSPWNRDRVLLALTGQTEGGLQDLQYFLRYDPWFYQLRGDTVLVSTTQANPSPYDTNAYQLRFLEQADTRRIENTDPLTKVSRFLQDNWFLLPTGIISLCLLLYGITQLYLKQIAGEWK